jgi:hypothetical protein
LRTRELYLASHPSAFYHPMATSQPSTLSLVVAPRVLKNKTWALRSSLLHTLPLEVLSLALCYVYPRQRARRLDLCGVWLRLLQLPTGEISSVCSPHTLFCSPRVDPRIRYLSSLSLDFARLCYYLALTRVIFSVMDESSAETMWSRSGHRIDR